MQLWTEALAEDLSRSSIGTSGFGDPAVLPGTRFLSVAAAARVGDDKDVIETWRSGADASGPRSRMETRQRGVSPWNSEAGLVLGRCAGGQYLSAPPSPGSDPGPSTPPGLCFHGSEVISRNSECSEIRLDALCVISEQDPTRFPIR